MPLNTGDSLYSFSILNEAGLLKTAFKNIAIKMNEFKHFRDCLPSPDRLFQCSQDTNS